MPEDREINWEAARELRKRWDSPELWPRIASDLRREKRRRWMGAAAGIAATVLLGFGIWSWQPTAGERPELLAEQVLADLERSEALHLAAIDRLARLATPRIEQPASPLMAAYAEKLVILDAAIAELESEIEGNRFNAHLRLQMAALYRDKQQTLEEVIRFDPNMDGTI